MTCLVCKKPLSATHSVIRGIGPVCARREAQAPFLFAAEEIKPTMPILADFVFIRGGDGLLRVLAGRVS
jgi:hypothetical protein